MEEVTIIGIDLRSFQVPGPGRTGRWRTARS